MRNVAFLALAALAVTASAAAAQQGHAHHGQAQERPAMAGMMEGMEHGMMAAMPAGLAGPMMLLEAKETLGLDAGQVAALEALQASCHEAHHPHMEAAKAARERAKAALGGEAPDLAAFEAALEEAAGHDVAGQVGMAGFALQARALLTEEQRARVAELHHGMMGAGHGTGHGAGHGAGSGSHR